MRGRVLVVFFLASHMHTDYTRAVTRGHTPPAAAEWLDAAHSLAAPHPVQCLAVVPKTMVSDIIKRLRSACNMSSCVSERQNWTNG